MYKRDSSRYVEKQAQTTEGGGGASFLFRPQCDDSFDMSHFREEDGTNKPDLNHHKIPQEQAPNQPEYEIQAKCTHRPGESKGQLSVGVLNTMAVLAAGIAVRAHS